MCVVVVCCGSLMFVVVVPCCVLLVGEWLVGVVVCWCLLLYVSLLPINVD